MLVVMRMVAEVLRQQPPEHRVVLLLLLLLLLLLSLLLEVVGVVMWRGVLARKMHWRERVSLVVAEVRMEAGWFDVAGVSGCGGGGGGDGGRRGR